MTVKMRLLNGFKAVLLVFLWLPMSAFAAEITASVDRSQLSLNDSFQVVFQANESPDDDPDFTPLAQDFSILNQSKSNQSSWVNGAWSHSISWTLNVMAKRAGELQIPAIHFGDDVSNPLTITVQYKTANTASAINEELFLDVEISANDVYVQEQVLYTVRIYHRVSLAQASLTEPMITSAIIEKMGQDKQYNRQIKGVNYRVIERRYAIFPQQSGELKIPPLTLNAQVVYSGSRSRLGSLFDSQRTRTKRILSKELSVNIRPIPNDFKGKHWLVADGVSLDQKWSGDQLNITVGEPITQTVTMKATGSTASQLPDFTVADIQGVKLYADQPVLTNSPTQEGVVGQREQKIAYIASKAGDFLLPAYEVPWFNRSTGKIEMATIPSITLWAVAQQGAIDPVSEETTVTTEVAVDQSQQITESSNQYWKWLAVALAVVWLATLALMYKGKKAVSHAIDVESKAMLSKRRVMSAIELAVATNDAIALKKGLIDWCELEFSTRDINTLLPRFSPDLQQQVDALNASLYSKNKGSWTSKNIVELLKKQAVEEKHSKKESPLRALNRV